MAYAWRWLRSLFFSVQMYFIMFVLGLCYTPLAVLNREYALHGTRIYCRWVRWTASWMIGLKSEVRGHVPTEEVIIAAKHQSFFDIILLISALPRPRFIMKAELRFAPILGWFAMRIGCVPVKRGQRVVAMKKMVLDVAGATATPGQLVVYPQGTRVAAGAYLPYKPGVSVLRGHTGRTVVPAATNVGVFWPRRGIYRKPGLAVMEFMEPIPAPENGGPSKAAFLEYLEGRVEAKSGRLMEEAGFMVTD
ncbi:MAG: 1-acyl-sn-glycerol-3-phosphate acyltransferase [Rhodobacteraceae bacterium]|nr:1-acyl-sn-glycerol-3-phosphate acyltransferase [Paracoccaceae bacterium]